MQKQMRWIPVLVLGAALAGIGCGDDGKKPTPAKDGGSDSGTKPVVDSGTKDSGTDGGGTGGMAATGIPCGAKTCTTAAAPAGLPITLPAACCFDKAAGVCSTVDMSGVCTAPPVSDPRCPTIAPILGMAVASCCDPQGWCGLDGSALGMGCVAFATIRTGAAAAFIMVPAADTRCAAGSGDGGGDAGN